MSARQGWIGEPQPQVEWRDSHYSREGEKIARAQAAQLKADEQAAWEADKAARAERAAQEEQ